MNPNLIFFFIISIFVNFLLVYKYSNLREKCKKYEKLLLKDVTTKLPSSAELLEAYREKEFRTYTLYAILPFLEGWRKKIIEKGKEGKEIYNNKVVSIKIRR
ncbi:MAG: hypothetical protein M0R03_14455 [Novosphingobium sp.]|nr:hypothetical protein [Novosphingobium sp.]